MSASRATASIETPLKPCAAMIRKAASRSCSRRSSRGRGGEYLRAGETAMRGDLDSRRRPALNIRYRTYGSVQIRRWRSAMPGPDPELLLASALREAALDAHVRAAQPGTAPAPPLGP